MMTESEKRKAIKQTLMEWAGKSDFGLAAKALLNTLGYDSTRGVDISSDPKEFMKKFSLESGAKANTKKEKALIKAAKFMSIIFNYGDQELYPPPPPDLLNSNLDSEKESFLFVAVKLKSGKYSRSTYAAFTREINKHSHAPVIVLFYKGAHLTMGFQNRRPHKTDTYRDVLESVSLLSNIDCNKPHRGHLDILRKLSLSECRDWMNERDLVGFKGLHAAWMYMLSVSVLNNIFYAELFEWFNRAKQGITLPANLHEKRDEWHIRLITRMLFVWFVKEAGLVANELFNETDIKSILNKFDGENDDSYYRAVLQNLFFAVLNTHIDERKFSAETRETHRNFNLYRYQKEIADPDRLRKLFNQTPFINGGLFDCLDDYHSPTSARQAGISGGTRVDYFSDKKGKEVSVPDKLFFGDHGLITLFERYKFTVHENTPVEQEVALDPELLGRTFEHLLAAHNPETAEVAEDARKTTGSYYTPREVVDYMVAESLTESLLGKIGGEQTEREEIRALFDYDDSEDDSPKSEFIETNSKKLVHDIANIRIFDPAVGSGAFPMSAVHLLSLALSKLDPNNSEWKKLQKARAQKDAANAFNKTDDNARKNRLLEIDQTFRRYSSEFGRKLYLIQNSIFGADIQPIACQIAKLRFFISLAIEQESNDDAADNYGIKPLPNLETRIVAADTLIALRPKGKTGELESRQITKKESEIKQNRERYFYASGRKKKLDCRQKDAKLREQLAELLTNNNFMAADDAKKIAKWDLYDQTAPAADWFDAEYMYGITDGFDIVIGNPPYVQLQRNRGELRKKYADQNFNSFHGLGDIYMFFYEKGLKFCRSKSGILMFITSNSWLCANYGQNLRKVLTRHQPKMLINMGKDVFDSVYVDANILMIQNDNGIKPFDASDINKTGEFPPFQWIRICPQKAENWIIVHENEAIIREKIKSAGIPLKDWDVKILFGVKTGYDRAFVITKEQKEFFCATNPDCAKIIEPTLRGRNIHGYFYVFADEWVIIIKQGWTNSNRGNVDPHKFFYSKYPEIGEHLTKFTVQPSKGRGLYNRTDQGDYWWELRPCSYYSEFEREKLVWIQLVDSGDEETKRKGRFAYDKEKLYPMASAVTMTGADIKYLLSLLNSRLISWEMQYIAPTSGMGALQWKKAYVEKLHIPKISKEKQRPFIKLAEKITAAKQANPAADTTADEKKIDRLVYQLYGLTEEEIKIVESPTTPQTE